MGLSNSPNKSEKEKAELLMLAVMNGDISKVEYSVDQGIKINSRDNFGYTALHVASLKLFLTIGKNLRKKPAEIVDIFIIPFRGCLSVILS